MNIPFESHIRPRFRPTEAVDPIKFRDPAAKPKPKPKAVAGERERSMDGWMDR